MPLARVAYAEIHALPQQFTRRPELVLSGKPSFAPMNTTVTSGCRCLACSRAWNGQLSMNGLLIPVLMRASECTPTRSLCSRCARKPSMIWTIESPVASRLRWPLAGRTWAVSRLVGAFGVRTWIRQLPGRPGRNRQAARSRCSWSASVRQRLRASGPRAHACDVHAAELPAIDEQDGERSPGAGLRGRT